jgi:glycosyltransferase involved in cell wall biosynthesis
MLTDLGHEVIHYGAEGAEVPCEHVTVLSRAVQEECYGGYDWHSEFFKHDPNDLAHRTFNANAIEAINARKRPGDFLLCSFGNYMKPIADGVQIPFTVEPGVGYQGVFASYRVFESYAWMHHVYGLLTQHGGSWYDAVIPNYFDPSDFLFSAEKDDYFLFVGRLISSKGIMIAAQVAERLKVPLIVAGQGSLEGVGLRANPFLIHKGTVGAAERAILMSRARAVFAPTQYIEPFGGVSIEANFCGTPVIATDWGAFSENIIHGVTGFRCRTFSEFLLAAKRAGSLCPDDIRRFAVNNFSMARVSGMFDHYFDQVADLDGQGWYTDHDQDSHLDWLKRWYPGSPESEG